MSFLINMLFVNSLHETQQVPPPFSFTMEVGSCNIPQTDEEIKTLSAISYTEYKEAKRPYGSVDVNPELWTRIAVDVVKSGKNVFPNGCCSRKDCYINIFYALVVKHMTKIIYNHHIVD